MTGVDDALVDGAVAYTVVTAAATSADSTYTGVDPADVSVTNTDNDAAGIVVDPTSGPTTTEAGGTATFTVVLTSQPTADVTVGLSSSDATEGTVPQLHRKLHRDIEQEIEPEVLGCGSRLLSAGPLRVGLGRGCRSCGRRGS